MDYSFFTPDNITHPAVWIAAAAPAAAAIIVWLAFSLRFGRRLSRAAAALRKMARAAEAAEGRSRENLPAIERAASGAPPAVLCALRALTDDAALYDEPLPSARTYFTYDRLVRQEGCRGGRQAILYGFWALLLLSAALPPAAALLYREVNSLPASAMLGLGVGALLCAGQVLFLLADAAAERRAETGLSRFCEAYDRAVPTADAAAAILLGTVRENRLAFDAAAGRIVDKFDRFTGDTVIPALKEAVTGITAGYLAPALGRMTETIEAAVRESRADQQQSLREMTSAFADRLAGTVQPRMEELAETVGGVAERLALLRAQLAEAAADLNGAAAAQSRALTDSAAELARAGELQRVSAERAEALQQTLIENSRILSAEAGRMAASAEQFASLASYQQTLRGAVESCAAQYAQLEGVASGMISGVSERMKSAMSDVGREIAAGIREITADNAEAIAKLTEQAERLRQDYDGYFASTAESQKSMLEDLDFHVQNVISRVTGDVGALLERTTAESNGILEQHRSNTAELLKNFDEQIAGISLYVKELNYDINSLSESLKESSAQFADQVRQGVGATVEELDEGLALLSQKIANTVESIRDAVEALPAALERR